MITDDSEDSVGELLLADSSFRAVAGVDEHVPKLFGLYAIRLRQGSTLPDPFDAVQGGVIYIGEARTQTLRRRLLGNELQARGNGTFFRSLGAVLGFRPPFGSSAAPRRASNYRFSPDDVRAITRWMDDNLEVSWLAVPVARIHSAEVELIGEIMPVLNLRDNPRARRELVALRRECRRIAAGHDDRDGT